jgi:hypothetical protein
LAALAMAYGSDPFAYDFEAALAAAAPASSTNDDADELERAYLATCRPPKGYDLEPDHRILELVPPTPAQLKRHREKFEPPEGRKYADARLRHRAACDEVARLYSLTSGDIEQIAFGLRSKGASVPEIAERCGLPQGKVRMIVRGAQKRGSAAQKTTARSA